MNVVDVIPAVIGKFTVAGSPAAIPLLREQRTFTAELTEAGIVVDNLGAQPFLPWAAFQEAVCVMIRLGGRAKRGDAMNNRLGDPALSVDSVEGHIAHVVYGKELGDAVLRRITPVACLLIWAGVCRAAPGELVLL
jgi:hypothetical protein